jgi:hypothetical protein
MSNDVKYLGPLPEEVKYLGPLPAEDAFARLRKPQGRVELAVGTEPLISNIPQQWRDPKHPEFVPSIFARPRQIDITGAVGAIKEVGKYAGAVNLKKAGHSPGSQGA